MGRGSSIDQLPTNPALERWIADITQKVSTNRREHPETREAARDIRGVFRARPTAGSGGAAGLCGPSQAKAIASRAEGEARMLVRILRRSGLDVSPAIEARVLATADTALLETWADRALSGASIDDVFAEP